MSLPLYNKHSFFLISTWKTKAIIQKLSLVHEQARVSLLNCFQSLFSIHQKSLLNLSILKVCNTTYQVFYFLTTMQIYRVFHHDNLMTFIPRLVSTKFIYFNQVRECTTMHFFSGSKVFLIVFHSLCTDYFSLSVQFSNLIPVSPPTIRFINWLKSVDVICFIFLWVNFEHFPAAKNASYFESAVRLHRFWERNLHHHRPIACNNIQPGTWILRTIRMFLELLSLSQALSKKISWTIVLWKNND